MLLATLAPAAAEEGPVAKVEAIYAPYLVKTDDPAATPDQLDPALYSARRKAQLARLQKACEGKDMCLPDFDHLVNGQDYALKGLKIEKIAGDDRRATVAVRFSNFKTPQRFVFTLVKENDRWLIDQIDGGSKNYRYTLDDVFKPNF